MTRHPRRVLSALAVASVAFGVAACGDEQRPPAAAPSTSVPAVSADACRAYDNAISAIVPGVDGQNASVVFAFYGHAAADKVKTAAKLTHGQARSAMEATALRVEVLADAYGADPFGVDTAAEAQAVRDIINAVDKLCRAAGASLSNVPAPDPSGSPG